jgi:hypothetical protein
LPWSRAKRNKFYVLIRSKVQNFKLQVTKNLLKEMLE